MCASAPAAPGSIRVDRLWYGRSVRCDSVSPKRSELDENGWSPFLVTVGFGVATTPVDRSPSRGREKTVPPPETSDWQGS